MCTCTQKDCCHYGRSSVELWVSTDYSTDTSRCLFRLHYEKPNQRYTWSPKATEEGSRKQWDHRRESMVKYFSSFPNVPIAQKIDRVFLNFYESLPIGPHVVTWAYRRKFWGTMGSPGRALDVPLQLFSECSKCSLDIFFLWSEELAHQIFPVTWQSLSIWGQDFES